MPHRPPAPLLLAFLGLASGSIIEHMCGPLSPALWPFLVMPPLLVAIRWRGNPIVRTVAILILLASSATINASFLEHCGQNHIRRRLNKLQHPRGAVVTLEGRIASFPTRRRSGWRFPLEIACIRTASSCPRISGRVYVMLMSGEDHLAKGDVVVVSGQLHLPRRRRNPADFDAAKWLSTNRSAAFLSRARINTRTGSTNLLMGFLASIRTSVRNAITRVVPKRSQDLPFALLLGDRSSLSQETRDHFARSGLMHLLAISGLHVLLVGLVLHRLMRPSLIRIRLSWQVAEWVRSTTTLAILVGYALVSGSSPSVVRAVMMTGFLLIGNLTRGVSNPLNALGGAGFAILLLDPTTLVSPSFQLSFSAVLGLLLQGRGFGQEVLSRIRSRVGRYVAGSVMTSYVASLATTPALLYHFGYVGISGIVLNVIAIPVGGALLCTSIITTLTALAVPWASLPLGEAVDCLSQTLKSLAAAGGTSDALLLSPSDVTSSSISAILLLAAFLSSKKGVSRRLVFLAALTPPLILLLCNLATGRFSPKMEILFLDVGHGDAAILKLPDEKAVVIDAGNRSPFRDEGSRTVIPNLHAFGVEQIDLMMVSHPHSDHLGGVLSLLEQNVVDRLVDNGQRVDTKLYRDTRNAIARHHIKNMRLSAGDVIPAHPWVRMIVLAPPRDATILSPNDQSIVLKVFYGNDTFLFTGDIERGAERYLTTHHCPLLLSDVVKVPHHGSSTSTTKSFVACTTDRLDTPSYAVVSVGSPAKYGLPDQMPLARWRSSGRTVHSTFTDGALWLFSNGKGIHKRSWLE